MCIMCLMLTLSGPVELLFLHCFIAAWTCVVVSVRFVVCSLSVLLSMCLFVLWVLCLTVLVNCLLNAFPICVGEVNVFSLKVMVLFLCCVVFLLANLCIVFQRVFVLCLLSQCVSVCSLHMSNCCVCMRDVISEFGKKGSHAFCALMLFQCSIVCLMCSASTLHMECILPFDMLRLSVWGMMFVKMVFAVFIWWWLNVRENSLRVCSKLCPVCFPIVHEYVSFFVVDPYKRLFK